MKDENLGNVRRNGILPWQHTAIVLSRLRGVEFSGDETRPCLLFFITNNCNKSCIFYKLLFTTQIELTCFLKLHGQKSMRHHQLTPLQPKVLPNTVEEFILFMSARFTQGQQLGPDSLMAEPPFFTAKPALWSWLGSHSAQRIETSLKYSIMH